MAARWGCALPSPTNTTTYAGLTVSQSDAGQHMDLVGWYGHWLDNGGYRAFNTGTMDYIYRNGSTPVFCWQATNSDQAVTANSLTVDSIIAGTHDAYISQWAQDAKAWGKLFYLRVLHEFDGNWYSWGVGNNGSTAAKLVTAWQHIVSIFRTVGASNVLFVWNPDRVTTANQSVITAAYPGDAWVDWIGCDGYNFSVVGGKTWQTGEQVFDLTLTPSTGVFAALAPSKPVMICEVGCAEDPAYGDKGAWISHLYGYLIKSKYTTVRAVLWMQDVHTGANDNTFESVTAPSGALAAFQSAVALSYFKADYLTVSDPVSGGALYLPYPI